GGAVVRPAQLICLNFSRLPPLYSQNHLQAGPMYSFQGTSRTATAGELLLRWPSLLSPQRRYEEPCSQLRQLSPFRAQHRFCSVALVLSRSASLRDRRERRTSQDTAARHFPKLSPQRIAHLRRSSDESSERGLLGIREGVGLIEREIHLRITDRDGLLDQMIARQ